MVEVQKKVTIITKNHCMTLPKTAENLNIKKIPDIMIRKNQEKRYLVRHFNKSKPDLPEKEIANKVSNHPV
jgi:hypothetical protein